MDQTKPWYRSKIFMLALLAVLTYGGNFVTGFVTGNGVTQEQIDAVAQTQPLVATTIENVQSGQNIFQALTTLAFGLIGFWRLWFTKAQIGARSNLDGEA